MARPRLRWPVLTALLLVAAQALEAQQVNTLRWMAGCWRQLEAGVMVEELWLAPAGGTMIGMSRTVEDDSTRSTEQMVIRPAVSGGLVFEAAPSGQEPGAFLAAIVTDTLVIFENLTHDFPQQIRYSRLPGDSLLATISGTVRDRLRSITFRYNRSACPGS